MRKQALSFFFFVMMNLALMAQDDCSYQQGRFIANMETSLFGDKVNVRSKPASNAEIIGNLSIGTQVNILENSRNEFKWNGFTASWYKVSFDYKGLKETGYIWGGLLSLARTPIQGNSGADDMLVYGISSWDSINGYNSAARILRDGKMLTSLDFEPISSGFSEPGVFNHTVCLKVMDNRGFAGIKNVISIEYVYEACGYENGEVFLLWDGNRLTYLGEAIKVNEAGVFHYSYDVIFPDDEGGQPDKLVVRQKLIEYTESGDDLIESPEQVTVNTFAWNGKTVDAQKQ